VSLIGTFAVLYSLGYSANTLSLFAIILALTMVVDDAIVVVESVETLMAEGQSRTAATALALRQIRRAGDRHNPGAAGGVCAGGAAAGDCRRAVPPVCGDALPR
jgi:Cu/Ag efflux pump CusA